MLFARDDNDQEVSTFSLLFGAAALSAGAYWLYRRQQAPPRSFRGQVVLITGSSRGLGLEMARLFVAEGAQVVLTARTSADLERAAAELRSRGGQVLAIASDVTNVSQVEQLVRQVIEHFGRIDVLINNAGIIQVGPLDCMTSEDFETAMATHFWGPLRLIQQARPHMPRGASIVNIASIGGEISVPHLLPYSASKFALVGLSEGLHHELAAAGISVTTVCPGLMRTGSPRNAMFKGKTQAEYAWFSIGGSLPGGTVSSEQAAREIVAACRARQPYLRVSWLPKVIVPLRSLLPGLASSVLSIVNSLLPSAEGGTKINHPGHECFSSVSPSVLTTLTEQAAARNNEVR